MSKSTLFIAVQCYQCSTMQVKQQKKSSNKWNCAVCNEKQSLRKVYAQSYQAKDIRHFVQSCNMSRNVSGEGNCGQSSSGHFVEHLEGDNVIAVKTRSDWSEYVDVDEDCLEPAYWKSKSLEKNMTVCKVVTELPDELMFKKPKLKGNYASSYLKAGENQAYRTQFSRKSDSNENRGYRTQFSRKPDATKQLTKTRPDSDQSANIMRKFQQRNQKNKDLTDNIVHSRDISGLMKTGGSRWDEYLTMEDNDYNFKGKKSDFTVESKFTDDNNVQTNDSELLVEDEIHPDFI